jgi:hypothetical protein
MNIDRKYKIHAVNPCSRNTHDEYDSILFLAKDKAVPAMLRAYLKESEKLGANPAHLESIGLLIGRVEQYQREVEAKIPDTDLPCEIRRCVDGEGVSDNKQDLAPGAQNVPKAVAYLDLGVGGYMDIGTDLTDEELATLPKGRHMLGIIGTYGVDGYVPAQPAPSVPTTLLVAVADLVAQMEIVSRVGFVDTPNDKDSCAAFCVAEGTWLELMSAVESLASALAAAPEARS